MTKNTAKIDKLIEKSTEVLKTHTPNPPSMIGFPTLNNEKFTSWKTQCINFLETELDSNNVYVKEFKDKVSRGYISAVESGVGILKALKDDWMDDDIDENNNDKAFTPIDDIVRIIDSFHAVARQLRSRHENRNTLDVNDKYDVQDLFHALLLQHFKDIRPEEWTPSYAGKSARMDFLVKDCDTIVETKMTRKGLGDKELGDQLLIDIARYGEYRNCNTLVCFVYDPEGRIVNPRGIEKDLSRRHDNLDVLCLIRPLC